MVNLKRKVNTLLWHPDKVVIKYKRKIFRKLRREMQPISNENYDRHWGYLSFKGKVVLDLGADYGSTAYYFLKKGATKIVAVEGDPKLASKLRHNYRRNYSAVCIEKWLEDGQGISNLIAQFAPSIVKVDIEGEEKSLLSVDILKVKEWLVETHSQQVHNTLVKFFLAKGFNVSVVNYGCSMGNPEIKVLVATLKVLN